MTKIIYRYNDVYQEPNKELVYCHENFRLYFSSTTNLKRFKKRFEETKERFKYWINVFNLEYIDFDIAELLYTYELVEKRGFLVDVILESGKVEYSCQEEMKKHINLIYFKG